jgi:uncharacterized protein
LRLAIIADTHMPKGARALPERCVTELRRADLIVHLGDFSSAAVLEGLRAIGPSVVAVHGNVDEPVLRRELPEATVLNAEGVTIGLVHDAGPARGRLRRMRKRFPDADAVLFAHSHMPLHERSEDFQIFNPGSPTERRRAPQRSMGLADARAGRLRLRHLGLA